MVNLRDWIGRTESRTDQITAAPMAALAATLDRDDPYPQGGDPLPPLWHWLYFVPIERQSQIDADGHAARGGFMPPVPLPRRMFAGGRIQFHRPLRVGATVSRTARMVDVTQKKGQTGPLVFVRVRREIGDGDGVAIAEEYDVVYRENAKPDDPVPTSKPAPKEQTWEREIRPDETLLFRYSALTFNAHRIHYDRRYVTETEGYPGLVVHGPLIATLLCDLLRRNLQPASVVEFAFRAVRPLFDTAPFSVCGMQSDERTVKLWAKDVDGWLAMDATAKLN